MPAPQAVDLRRLRLTRIADGQTWHIAYRRPYWPALFNASGRGNGRFSPLVIDGAVVPTMYAAVSQTVALLETSFHDVHQTGTRVISESLQLSPFGLVALTVPEPLRLIDLTDEGLDRIGLTRNQLTATTPEHYACTREWAVALHGRGIGGVTPVGLRWQSRIAELAGEDSLLLGDLLGHAGDAHVVFGDRVSIAPAEWHPGDPHYEDLLSGDGRLLAEQIAGQLGAVIVPT